MKKVMIWIGVVLGGLAGLALLAGLGLYPIGMKKLTHTYPGIPVETVTIPTGTEAVARGRHVSIVWGCTKCHGENLGGRLLAGDPFIGTIPASNLTSGSGGIGESYTDADCIRAIRHNIKPNGRAEIFMYNYYSALSDQDLGDLIAYLEQIPPVDAEYPGLHYGSIFPIAPAVGLFLPAAELIDHNAPHPADPAPSATIEYGRYLSVLCTECHGTSLAGKLENWKQEDFIRPVQTGVLPDGKQLSPAMPLTTFSEMNGMELAALWLYLQSIHQ